ncbi:MAG: hypothetical protein SF123_09735 [Chloroflexota bacterium]|nr:hypothetical protein [Chloroflexota bacterium]
MAVFLNKQGHYIHEMWLDDDLAAWDFDCLMLCLGMEAVKAEYDFAAVVEAVHVERAAIRDAWAFAVDMQAEREREEREALEEAMWDVRGDGTVAGRSSAFYFERSAFRTEG